jgi:hypothetical protein
MKMDQTWKFEEPEKGRWQFGMKDDPLCPKTAD